jgi:rod shape-determining protein MreB and related proteins
MRGLRRAEGVRAGSRPWSRLSTALALDVGSMRTRAWVPDRGLIVDAPTTTQSHAGVSGPVTRGKITDVAGASRMLQQLLIGRFGRLPQLEYVVATTPVLYREADRIDLRAAVEFLQPGTVITIDGVKAAAIGAKIDLIRPLLVIDLGARLSEIALLANGSVVDARRVSYGTADLGQSGTVDNLVEHVRGMVTGLLRQDCGPLVVDALDRGPLVVGGGAARPAITYQLSKQLSCIAQPAPAAYTLALRGASAVADAVRRHPGLPLS